MRFLRVKRHNTKYQWFFHLCYLLFCAFNNCVKVCCFKGSTADKAAVDVWHGEKFFCKKENQIRRDGPDLVFKHQWLLLLVARRVTSW